MFKNIKNKPEIRLIKGRWINKIKNVEFILKKLKRCWQLKKWNLHKRVDILISKIKSVIK